MVPGLAASAAQELARNADSQDPTLDLLNWTLGWGPAMWVLSNLRGALKTLEVENHWFR